VNSFARTPKWMPSKSDYMNCNAMQNVDDCASLDYCLWHNFGRCIPSNSLKAEKFFDSVVSGQYQGYDVTFNYRVFTALVFGLLLAAFFTYFGLALVGKLATFTALSSLVFYMFMLFTVWNAPNVSNCFRVANTGSFVDGVSMFPQVCWTLVSSWGILIGAQMTVSSFNSVSRNITLSGLVVTVFRVFCVLVLSVIAVRLEGSSNYFNPCSTFNTDFTDSAEEMSKRIIFIVFPVFLGTLSLGPVLSIVFFFFQAMYSVITLSIIYLVISGMIKESSFHVPSRPWVLTVCVWIFILFVTIPVLFHYKQIGLTEMLDSVSSYSETWGVPVMGLVQTLAVIWTTGWRQLRKYYRAISLCMFNALFLVGVLVWTSLSWIPPHKVVTSVCIVSGIAIVLTISFVAAFIAGPRHLPILRSIEVVVIGDAEVLRRKLNRILAGDASVMRLRRLWTPWYKFGTITSLLVVISYSISVMATSHKWEQIAFPVMSMMFVVVIVYGAIFPAHWGWFRPPAEQEFRLEDVPLKKIEQTSKLRRLTFFHWEEFTAPTALWHRSFELRVKTLS